MIATSFLKSTQFLRSREWDAFQKSLGRKTWRVEDTLVIRHDLPGRVNYLYCPRPEGVTGSWLYEVERIAKSEGSIFLKVDPVEKLPITNYQLPICGSDSIQPQKTTAIDLSKSEWELLTAMHEKTRYNIRLAERRGVLVALKTDSDITMERWWRMLQETAGRDGFHPHERQYYEKQLEIRSESFLNKLFFAEYKGETLAAALVNFYRDSASIGVATYLHGASGREYKDVMAPHLLHWRIIQEAKQRGFRYYDLWGIDEKRWPGITRFKLGFGGKIVEYPPSVDVVYRPLWYKWYKLAKRFY